MECARGTRCRRAHLFFKPESACILPKAETSGKLQRDDDEDAYCR